MVFDEKSAVSFWEKLKYKRILLPQAAPPPKKKISMIEQLSISKDNSGKPLAYVLLLSQVRFF